MYRIATWLGITGVRLAGIKIEVRRSGAPRSVAAATFFCRTTFRTSTHLCWCLRFRGGVPYWLKKRSSASRFLGTAMRMADMVPVDRHNREAAIDSVRAAVEVMRRHVHMVIFVEGRGRGMAVCFPSRKGRFHLAMEVGVPVVPVTLLGTYECWPKGSFASHAGTATVVFHPPIEPSAVWRPRDTDGQPCARQLPARYRKNAGIESQDGWSTLRSMIELNGTLKVPYQGRLSRAVK